MTDADRGTALRGEGPDTLTLCEELLLLALDPARGRPAGEPRPLRRGLAGAVLADLEARGAVTEVRGWIFVSRPEPTGTPLLDDALTTLRPAARRNGVRLQEWIRRYARRAQHLAAGSLAARGTLRAESHRALGLFPRVRHRVLDPDLRFQRLGALLTSANSGFPDARSRDLAALLTATGLAPLLGIPPTARQEMWPLVRESWPAAAVRKKAAARSE